MTTQSLTLLTLPCLTVTLRAVPAVRVQLLTKVVQQSVVLVLLPVFTRHAVLPGVVEVSGVHAAIEWVICEGSCVRRQQINVGRLLHTILGHVLTQTGVVGLDAVVRIQASDRLHHVTIQSGHIVCGRWRLFPLRRAAAALIPTCTRVTPTKAIKHQHENAQYSDTESVEIIKQKALMWQVDR